jgi:hypothetical protein
MPAATKKDSAAATADEAQTEATPVDPKPDLGAFRRAFSAMKEEVYARVDGQVKGLREEVANLAALAEAGQGADPDLLEGIKGQLAALTDGRVTRNELTDLEQRLDAMAETVSDRGVQHGAASSTPGTPKVYGQVLELMRLVEEIGKDGEADFGKGQNRVEYRFRGVDQAMNAVGSAMRHVGLIMRTEVLDKDFSVQLVDRMYNGKKEGVVTWTTARVTMRYTFVSPLDGSTHSVEGLGVGKDNGDKDGSKALAAAMKYALFQGLCIPIKGMNIDPEDDHPVTEERRSEQRLPEPSGRAVRDEQAPPPEPPAALRPHEQQPGESAEAYRARRAQDALTAAMRPGVTFAQLATITKQAGEVGLLTVPVGEYPSLKHALTAISQTVSYDENG